MPPRGLAIWWQAIRPATLTLSAAPVFVGIGLARATTDVTRWDGPLIAMIAAMAIQAGTNLHNDAADYINGTDRSDRQGPPRVTERGWATAGQVLMVAHLAFAFAVACGVYLVWLGGWPILLLGLLSIAAGYAYSAGPLPISRTPLGELFVILFFGIGAVWGTAYLATGQHLPLSFITGFAVGLPTAAVLLVNNTRDRHGDARVGRATLGVLIGRRGVNWLFGFFSILPFAIAAGIAASQPAFIGAFATVLAFPLAGRGVRKFARARTAEDFNACLRHIVGIQGLFSILLAGGWLVFPI